MSKDSKNDLDLLTATPPLPNAAPVRRRLGELLVEAGFLTPRDLDAGLASQALSGGPVEHGGRKKLGQILLGAAMISDAQLTQTLGQQLSVPFVSLKHVDFSPALLARVPAELAQAYTMLPVFLRSTKKLGETLYVAMEDPTNQEALLEVSMRAGLPVKPMIASPADLHRAIRAFYFGEHGDAETAPEPLPPAERSPDALMRRQTAPTLTGSRGGGQVPPKPPPPKTSTAPGGHGAPSAPAIPAAPPPVIHMPAQIAPAPPPTPPRTPPTSLDDDDDAPEIEVSEVEIPLRPLPAQSGETKGGNITLLDGTSVALPRRTRPSERPPAPAPSVEMQATRDLVLRLRQEGGEAGKVTAALLNLLLSRGLIAEADLHAELRKILA